MNASNNNLNQDPYFQDDLPKFGYQSPRQNNNQFQSNFNNLPVRDDDLDSPGRMLQQKQVAFEGGQQQHPTYLNELNDDQRDLDFIKFKQQQREFLENKLKIQTKIEGLQREYNFYSKLDKDDMNYILQARREKAAILIQRAYRKIQKSKKEILVEEMRKAGAFLDQLTEEDIKTIEQRKKELKNHRERHQARRPDTFYSTIDKERRSELAEKVLAKKRLYIHSDIQKRDHIEIDDIFSDQYGEFLQNYRKVEENRLKAIENLREIEVMSEYLVKKDHDQLDIKNIVVWSQLEQNFTPQDEIRIRKEHLARLERYRKRKEWEAWIEDEDDLDIEGERILAEIKNYQAEHFYNIGFS
ncbi:UNKNOWN [Stylonychia lemnae]|uniref:Uncharacterized protein n=1 Tax=Stylonychia lemnae TaxID=5949 RepID=A0A077ZRM9_STYLE|nr:UNKNOWN [Stylonychia lemnae]|eukprot:CDW72537.1 UNKNOWN [Stylonychia lemnae]